MSDTTVPQHSLETVRPVKPREMVVFHRSWATYSHAGRCWHLQVRGSIFATARKRLHKRVLLHLFQRVVKPERETEIRRRFHDRAHLFLQDTKKGKSIPIAIAEKAYALPDSLPNGHFETTITIPEEELRPAVQINKFGRPFVQFCAHVPDPDGRLFAGEIELISPEGISVISDVDDTIKITNVGDRRELLANTFTREFRSVQGMAELYQSWARTGISFHYVSASPWPLYGPLVDWLDSDGFPVGTMHLRHVRLRDLRRDKKKENSFRNKRAAVELLLRLYPQRHFILCGDSGERDAELYGEIARQFGPQIQLIAIRCHDAPVRSTANEVASRLSHIDSSRWLLFEDPAELAEKCAQLKLTDEAMTLT